MPTQRIKEFDLWRPGYGLATVSVKKAGTDTLADIYTDEALTAAAANPQTLSERIIDSISYGKFSATLYTSDSYYLEINSADQTGVARPSLLSLSGADGSPLVVTPDGASQSVRLDKHLARRIDARDYGELVEVGGSGASSSTNNATITAAIGAASALGGGYVEIPSGTYAFTNLSIPSGVVLRGVGRGATILQSTYAGNVATIEGARGGLERITLDGVSQVSNSNGLYAVAKDQIHLFDCEIKRFEAGLFLRGGKNQVWFALHVSTCVTGARLRGDLDAGDSAAGAEFANLLWVGGAVEFCSTNGVHLEYVDEEVTHTSLEGIYFNSNTGTALNVEGARNTRLVNPVFVENTTNIAIDDGDPLNTYNSVIGFTIENGRMSGGAMTLDNNLEHVTFRQTEFADVDITITTPEYNIAVIDCREDASVTLSGATTAWVRQSERSTGASSGLTTGNSATKAWSVDLKSGQRAYIEAKVAARQRNGTRHGFWHLVVSAHRPAATLDYDTQTANFTVGDILTGGTSGATARITADSDSGATGTLSLQDVDGVFVDDETITDESGGSATANGAISESNVALLGPVDIIRRYLPEADLDFDGQTTNFTLTQTITGATSGATGTLDSQTDSGATGTLTLTGVSGIFVDDEALSDEGSGDGTANGVLQNLLWDVDIVANGPEVEVQVQGATSQTVEWDVDVEVVVNG